MPMPMPVLYKTMDWNSECKTKTKTEIKTEIKTMTMITLYYSKPELRYRSTSVLLSVAQHCQLYSLKAYKKRPL